MKSFLFILFLIPSLASAYPVFFKCESGGRLSDQLTPQEMSGRLQDLVSGLRALSPTARNARIGEYCDGGNLCMNELKSLMELAEAGGQATQAVIDAELARVRAAAAQSATQLQAITPMPAGLFDSAVRYQEMVSNVALARECRVAAGRLSPQMMELGNDRCVLANFHHSPYMYPAGVREAGDARFDQHDQAPGNAKCSAIRDLALAAISMDQDPYAAIAVSLMENGTEVEGLYLDPIGAVETLGCPTTRGTQSNHNLDSYSTYYNVQYQAVDNPALGNRIRDYLRIKGSPAGTGVSYACAGGDGSPDTGSANCNSAGTTATFCASAVPGMCCARLPFSVSGENAQIADKAITYSSLNRYLSTPLAANVRGTDPADFPARRLQRFNGYSDSMGGAEGVSAWRSGVNYYETPAYGYQAMDFILNTLWNNPLVKNAVEQAENTLNRRSKSMLCLDRGPGVYTIEHDHYFEKHANAPRMGTIQGRWRANPSWAALAQRHKNVMNGELEAVCSAPNAPSTFCNMPRETPAQMNLVVNEYFRSVHPGRRTVGQANRMDQGYSWGEMNDSQFNAFRTSFTGMLSGAGGSYGEEPETLAVADVTAYISDLQVVKQGLETQLAAATTEDERATLREQIENVNIEITSYQSVLTDLQSQGGSSQGGTTSGSSN